MVSEGEAPLSGATVHPGAEPLDGFQLAAVTGVGEGGCVMKLRITLLALFSAVASFAADALPIFNATLTLGKEHRFVLVNPTGKASGFLAIGESFDGYKLKGYDAKTGVLEVEKGGKVSPLTITADAAVVNAPARTPATIADANVVLGKMKFEEMMERALAGQKKMVANQFERMAAQMKGQGADTAEVAEFQKKITDEVFAVMDPKAMKDDVSKIYTEVFSKEELDQISSFYSTPLGEMLNAKQPEVQEKLGVIMQAKMMEVMPRVQRMGQEFGKAQKAKRDAAAGGGAVAPATKASPSPAPAPVPGPKQ